MKHLVYILIAVSVAVFANSISAIWAKQDSRFSPWLLAVILISPLVFITYGLVTARVGVAIASSVIDTLMIVGTIAVGLFIFKDIEKILALQYVGIALALIGVTLIIFSPHLVK